MKITSIGSENIKKITNHISDKFFRNLNTSEHVEFKEDIKTFYNKCLSNKNFFDSVNKSDYVIIDGLIENKNFSSNSRKIGFFYQKLVYYIYSINPSCKIFISIFNLNEGSRIKLIPNFLFVLKLCKVMGPENSANLNNINLNDHNEYLGKLFKLILTKNEKTLKDEKYSNLKKILEKKSNKVII